MKAMKTKQPWIFIVLMTGLILLSGVPAALAGDVEVKASISADTIGIEDVLIYTVSFKGIANPTAPDLSHVGEFRVASQSRNEEFSFINGVSSRYVKYLYYLTPLKTGKLTLPPVKYEYQGETYTTQPFTVEVVKGSKAPPQRSRRRSAFDDDFFKSPFERRRPQPQEIDVKLVPQVSQRQIVKGQQVIFKILLYTRSRIQGVNMISNQSFPGFWQEWFPMKQSIDGQTRTIDGKVYQIYEIRKAALFPTRSGAITIPSLKFEMTLGGDVFSMFADTRTISRFTPELTVQVSEPPAAAAGLPVGQFTFSVQPDKTEVDINDILTFKIKIKGAGNIKTIKVPGFQTTEYFRVYPSKISRDISYRENSVSGTAEAEIPVTFKQTGLISFPALEFNYFDPNSAGQKVVTLESQPLAVKVTGVKEKQEVSATVPETEVIKKGEDIDFIKKGGIYHQETNYYQTKTYLSILLLPFIITLLFAFKVFVFDRMIVQSSALKKRKLLAGCIKKLKNTRDRGDISPILEYYLKEKAGMGLSEINNRSIDQLLAKYGVRDNDIKIFIQLKSQSELSRFSPDKGGGGTDGQLKHDVKQLIDILKRIDTRIK
jgi:hypothetical protein